jgi:hypothetical protein
MRMLTAVTLGSVVALAGCANRPLAGGATLPPPRVVSSRSVSVPAPRPTAQPVTPRYQAPRYQAPTYQAPTYQAPTYLAPTYRAPATTAARVAPPAPPSMELLGSRGPTSNAGRNRVVPVSRSGLVQPAVAAPVLRTSARPAVATPAVAPPSATRSRPAATPCDVRSLFKAQPVCRPTRPSACPGGT